MLVESTLAFGRSPPSASELQAQWTEGELETAKTTYNLDISRVSGEAMSLARGRRCATRAPLSLASGSLLVLTGGGPSFSRQP